MTDLSLFWDESGEAGTSLNIKTHDAHVAELVHQNFGIFGRFSGFDMSGTHGIEGRQPSRPGTGTGPWSRRGCGDDGIRASWRAATAGQVPGPPDSSRIGTIHGARRTRDAQSRRNARESDEYVRSPDSRIPEWPHGRNAPAHPNA